MSSNLHDYLENLSDNQLLVLVKQGNEMAFNCIYNRYWKKLLIYSTKILNDQSLAEDILQDIFTKLWLNRNQSEIENLESYLFIAAKHKAISFFRKTKFTDFDEVIMDGFLSQEIQADSEIIKNELEEKIFDIVKNLPKRCKDIFYMSKFENYSNSEIAQHYNISKASVENQLYIAVKYLRIKLSKAIHLFF